MKNRVYEIILKRRSIRRFRGDIPEREVLERMVNAARLAPSAANKQPLEYIIIDDSELLPKVFKALRWAAYIAPKGTPPEGYEPRAYIMILVNKDIAIKEYPRDIGASAENIILTGLEEGLGSCWIRSFDRKYLSELLNLPANIELDSVIAIGEPDESPKIVEMSAPNEDIKYYRDENGQHYVPKRRLKDILRWNKYS